MRDERGWRFWLDEGHRDPVLGIEYLSEAYLRTDPEYDQRVTVPCVVDTVTGLVVTNDYPQITLDLSTQWRAYHVPGAPDLYPVDERAEMDLLIEDVYRDVNNGVYRCGFATTQEAYEAAYDTLFARLDVLEGRLADRRFLMGDHVREVDVRLFTTLVRFDAVYHGHFKTNRQKAHRVPEPVALRARACSRTGVSATPSTSTTSSGTTTSRTTRSTRPASCRRARTRRCGTPPESSRTVRVPSVLDLDDSHDHRRVLDLVDDSVRPAPCREETLEGSQQRLADAVRVLGQRSVDELPDGDRDRLRQRVAQGSLCGRRQDDPMGHAGCARRRMAARPSS
ncbi:hypothetical protein GCM10025868_34240 [Angustibacter aerolatus]|uniref:GST C-terminal domain-containing protein n=1 Tax=Angustibacter aerolatus TaxID=1162965 RepID=A0ABQ6JM28_9ACTN|nr:hypothetical protein GCM10025868_34240 [Angustibacter aerolatus]